MNCKLNKIFTKSCAAILAVSNIFSGVGAVKNENPGKASDKHNQLSVSQKEFGGCILGASGFATLATLFLSKMIFSANPAADTEEDIEAVKSMAIALAKTDGPKTIITGEQLLKLCGAKSCKELLKRGEEEKGKEKGKITVNLHGNEYVYRVSCPGNLAGVKPGNDGDLLSKLHYCLFSKKKYSLSKQNWKKELPCVINLITFSTGTIVGHRKCVVASVTANEKNAIESITKYNFGRWCFGQIKDSLIDITKEDELKKAFYPDKSVNAAVVNVGYWEKASSSSNVASSPSRGSEEEVCW